MPGAGLGAAITPPLIGHVIEMHGWAAGYRALGFMVLCLVPVALLWLRDTPSHGGPATKTGPIAGKEPIPAANSAALLTVLCISFFAIALSVNGYIVHLVPLMIDSGLSPTRAAWFGGIIGIAAIIGRLTVGYLLDQLPAVLIGVGIFLLAACGIVLLDVFGAQAAMVTALLIGFTVGAEVDLVAYLVSRLFAQKDYSRFFSRVYSAFVFGSGLSPFVAGWIYDTYGSYAHFLRISGALLVLVSVTFLMIYRIQRRDHRIGIVSPSAGK